MAFTPASLSGARRSRGLAPMAETNLDDYRTAYTVSVDASPRFGASSAIRRQEHFRTMIEALKSDEIVNKVGGRFKLTALIQKRMLELMDGARPLVERGNMTDLEVVVQEILQDKIAIDYEASGLVDPSAAVK